MDARGTSRLCFTLSDTDLDAAIDLLSRFYPSLLHPHGWAVLAAEWERRRLTHRPRDIEMTRAVFDRLPSVVQAHLRNNVSAERRAA
jgi:hypothetical protein